jgi:hypothetical protein
VSEYLFFGVGIISLVISLILLSRFIAFWWSLLVVCEVIDAGYLEQGKPMLYCETGDMDGSSQFFK